MKIRQKLLTAAVVTVLAAALLVSCAGNKTAKNLIGDWTFEAKGLALTAHFDEDGTYAFRFADLGGKPFTDGAYTVKKSSVTLSLEDDKTETYTAAFPDENTMTWSADKVVVYTFARLPQ